MLTSYTIDSYFGAFEAGGNAMLIRVAEINAPGKLQAVDSRQTEVFDLAESSIRSALTRENIMIP